MSILAGPALSGVDKQRARLVPWPVFLSAVFVLVFCAAYNVLVFDRVPHIHDEIAYLFQARIFLTGHFTAPLPCVPEAFDFPHIVNVGRWYSIYPPGFPFLLAIGLIFGAPWLINPILGAASVFLFYWLGVEVYDSRTGTLAAILGGLSIWLILMSSTMMSHTASMFFNGLGLLFTLRSLRSPTIRNGALTGLAFGAAFLVRPYNTVFFALPFMIYMVFRTLKEFQLRWKNAVSMALMAAVFLSFFLFYNASTTGSASKPGYVARYGKSFTVIFGRPATLDYDYTPEFGSIQIWWNLGAINDYVFGWPLSSLWLLVFVIWGASLKIVTLRRELFLLSAFLSMLVGFYFFWGAFIVLGARMFFEILPVVLLISARGLGLTTEVLTLRFPKIPARTWRRGISGVIAIFSLYGFLIAFPRWISPPDTEWYYARYDSFMCGSTGWINRAIAPLALTNAVVVTKFLYAPLEGFPTGWWGSGFLYDTPQLDGDIVFANDRGPALTRQLFSCFPGRTFYYYVGTLEKGVLVPLQIDGGRLRLGEPIVPETRPRHSSQLVASPREIFTLYSRDYEAFITGTLEREGLMDMDVTSLTALSRRHWEAGEYGQAVYALEAALQIEKNPKVRLPLLAELSRCYVKDGQSSAAKRIMTKYLEKRLYFISPDRGF